MLTLIIEHSNNSYVLLDLTFDTVKVSKIFVTLRSLNFQGCWRSNIGSVLLRSFRLDLEQNLVEVDHPLDTSNHSYSINWLRFWTDTITEKFLSFLFFILIKLYAS